MNKQRFCSLKDEKAMEAKKKDTKHTQELRKISSPVKNCSVMPKCSVLQNKTKPKSDDLMNRGR